MRKLTVVRITSIDELFQYTKSQLEGKQGNITINFVNHRIVYSGNDIIGNPLQEWLPSWFIYCDVDIRLGKF